MESGQFGTLKSRALAPVLCSLRLLLLFLLLPGAGVAATTAPAGMDVTSFDNAASKIEFPRDEDAIITERHAMLFEKAARQDSIPVIVRLRLTLVPEAILDAEEIRLQCDALAAAQQRVLKRLTATAPKTEEELGVKRFRLTPAFAIQVDARMLRELVADPEVLDVVEDTLSAPNFTESLSF